ncbi:MAG: GGDEF domain-containing protein [ANME-2 cluster archaeon]|nr:GGDEF domain-containing protein [ANME-2 cluster archaeon]
MDSKNDIAEIGEMLKDQLHDIADVFFNELLKIPETSIILKNTKIDINLHNTIADWIGSIFTNYSEAELESLIERQKRIGIVHATINVNLNYFNHGIGILKDEIYRRMRKKISDVHRFSEAVLIVGELFDIYISIISESYFFNELLHESNQLSLKVKGLTQNTAIECERLRSMLMEWSRNALMFLYQSPEINVKNIPHLQYSNFGLWVIYKSDFLSHPLNVSSELKQHISEIDSALFQAVRFRMKNKKDKFANAVTIFNDAVTKSSWFISTIVDQAIEIDTGMDPLTRLFNRRYLSTILRRQTEICNKQGLPYSILLIDLDHFKKINDEFGHDGGDRILEQFSKLLLESVRASDFIFRYGGEEFLIVMGNVNQNEAIIASEKIRKKCDKHIFKLTNNKNIHLTCSIGIAVHDGHPDYNRMVKKADLALYDAKNQGRNRAIFIVENNEAEQFRTLH